MKRQCPHALLVVGERDHRPARGQVPQSQCAVVTAGDHLRLGALAAHLGHGVGVACQTVYLRLGPDVPHLYAHTHTQREAIQNT